MDAMRWATRLIDVHTSKTSIGQTKVAYAMLVRERGTCVLLVWRIDTGRVRYVLSHDKILIVLGLVRREFRCGSEVPTVDSSGIGREFRRFVLN